MRKFRVINTDINLQCGRDCDTFKEAVQLRARILATLPDLRLSIKDIAA